MPKRIIFFFIFIITSLKVQDSSRYAGIIFIGVLLQYYALFDKIDQSFYHFLQILDTILRHKIQSFFIYFFDGKLSDLDKGNLLNGVELFSATWRGVEKTIS